MNSKNDPFPELWFPFTCYQDTIDYPPVVMDHGRGIYLYDEKGKGYVDAISSWWVNILGHNHPDISKAVKEQVDKLEHVLMAGFISRPAAELSHKLSSLLPGGKTRIFYSDDGSTAVEAALKIALQYWALKGERKTGFIALSGAYHGDTLGAMSVGNIPQYHSLFHQRYKRADFALSPYCYRCPLGKEKETCKAECMDSLEDILKEKADTTAACIFEPMVQAAAGMRIYPVKVLKKIFALCKKYSVLTIADEVAVGFGRTGKLFACEHVKEVPDIMCLAKGLTGGYLPLSATVVKESVFDEFCGDAFSGKIFHHGHSFTGNPLAAAAACAALTVIREEDIPRSLGKKIEHFSDQLMNFDTFEIVGDIRSLGMIGALELVKNRDTKEALDPEKRIPFRIAKKALEFGLLIRPLGNVIYFMPAYCINEDEIDNMFYCAQRAIKTVLNENESSL
ncbi:MAG: adenosylmethionine--8-amino-7-oxononanoate transaminase [Chitinivibrionales bacterium]|nr:adenosylmethionine--8-amino-7-oxononanoate transaminase [Chitinivibrionales bacterium]